MSADPDSPSKGRHGKNSSSIKSMEMSIHEEGYLHILTDSGNWMRAFCVLEETKNRFLQFASKRDRYRAPLGCLQFADIKSCDVDDCLFELSTDDGVRLKFNCQTRAQCLSWTRKLCQCCYLPPPVMSAQDIADAEAAVALAAASKRALSGPATGGSGSFTMRGGAGTTGSGKYVSGSGVMSVSAGSGHFGSLSDGRRQMVDSRLSIKAKASKKPALPPLPEGPSVISPSKSPPPALPPTPGSTSSKTKPQSPPPLPPSPGEALSAAKPALPPALPPTPLSATKKAPPLPSPSPKMALLAQGAKPRLPSGDEHDTTSHSFDMKPLVPPPATMPVPPKKNTARQPPTVAELPPPASKQRDRAYSDSREKESPKPQSNKPMRDAAWNKEKQSFEQNQIARTGADLAAAFAQQEQASSILGTIDANAPTTLSVNPFLSASVNGGLTETATSQLAHMMPPSMECDRLEGYLKKQTSVAGISRWQQRYFLVDSKKLSYVKSAKERLNTPLSQMSFTEIKNVRKKDGNIIKLYLTEDRFYKLMANSSTETDKWYSYLKSGMESAARGVAGGASARDKDKTLKPSTSTGKVSEHGKIGVKAGPVSPSSAGSSAALSKKNDLTTPPSSASPSPLAQGGHVAYAKVDENFFNESEDSGVDDTEKEQNFSGTLNLQMAGGKWVEHFVEMDGVEQLLLIYEGEGGSAVGQIPLSSCQLTPFGAKGFKALVTEDDNTSRELNFEAPCAADVRSWIKHFLVCKNKIQEEMLFTQAFVTMDQMHAGNSDDDDDCTFECIVIDNGSSSVKAGFGGEMQPMYMVKSMMASAQISARRTAQSVIVPGSAPKTAAKETAILNKGASARNVMEKLSPKVSADNKKKFAFAGNDDDEDDESWRGSRSAIDEIAPSFAAHRNKSNSPVSTAFCFGEEAWNTYAHTTVKMMESTSIRFNDSVFNYLEPNWDDIELMFSHVFDKLGVRNVDDHQLFVTVPVHCPANVKHRLAEILIEKFHAPAIHLGVASPLAMYSYGRTTGMVVDVGEQATRIVPIVDGYTIDHAVRSVQNLGGHKITEEVTGYLRNQSVIESLTEMQLCGIGRDVKEKYGVCCANPEDYATRVTKAEFGVPIKYSLPNRSSLILAQEPYWAGELSWQPRHILDDNDNSIVGVHELVGHVLNACSIDDRLDIVNNILLCGAGSTMHGFQERFLWELKNMLPAVADYIQIFNEPDNINSVWRGASILSGLPQFEKRWFSSFDYLETGSYQPPWEDPNQSDYATFR